jgi:PqqD family protein of HPr-rel-A system
LILPAADGRDAVTGRQWRRSGPPLIWEDTPGEGAVFDPASGETHFLSELPALLLPFIDRQWHDLASLIADVAGSVDLDDQHRAKILSALTFLESAELVESRYADKS